MDSENSAICPTYRLYQTNPYNIGTLVNNVLAEHARLQELFGRVLQTPSVYIPGRLKGVPGKKILHAFTEVGIYAQDLPVSSVRASIMNLAAKDIATRFGSEAVVFFLNPRASAERLDNDAVQQVLSALRTPGVHEVGVWAGQNPQHAYVGAGFVDAGTALYRASNLLDRPFDPITDDPESGAPSWQVRDLVSKESYNLCGAEDALRKSVFRSLAIVSTAGKLYGNDIMSGGNDTLHWFKLTRAWLLWLASFE